MQQQKGLLAAMLRSILTSKVTSLIARPPYVFTTHYNHTAALGETPRHCYIRRGRKKHQLFAHMLAKRGLGTREKHDDERTDE